MIVWGGGVDGQFLNTGGRYTPATDTWATTSPYGAPAPRWFHAAVWTGSEMIVWGGRANFSGDNNFNDGARYNPTTDGWTSVNTQGAPTARSQCVAVWTGEEMIVWGGETEGGVPLADGAAYNPVTDEWRPISNGSGLAPRMEPTAIWTGGEMIVFGGVDTTQSGWLSFSDGARYNPFTDSWAPLPTTGSPRSRTGHTAVWTGERMIVWGGRDLPVDSLLNDGAIYNPGSDTWTPIPFSYDPPQARTLHVAVWTGAEMIIWGGENSGNLLNTGARYNPATGLWTPTTQDNAPGKRMFWRPDLGIWTGSGMLVCAGSDYPTSLDSTALYTVFDPPCPPVIREQPQSVTATVGDAVTLAVGAQDCAASLGRSAVQLSTGPNPGEFVFETGARNGQVQFDYQFYTIPDSLRVYYDGERIYDNMLSGEGTLLVNFGPGSAQNVRIVVNEESGAQPGTAWEYTVSYRPPPLHYQWRKNGAALEGETNPTLHLAAVSLADAGDYSVVVANNRSAVISAVATLTIRPLPQTNCIPGLVAWWRGDGDATDVTGAHDGQLLFGTLFSPGVAGQAFTFDLSRARVSIPDDDAFKLTDSLSFEGWINVASYAPGIIFIRGDNRGGLDPYQMSMQPSGQIHWGISTANNDFAAVESPGVVPTGVWVHVAAVLDGATGNMGLYLNGSLVNQINTSLRPLRDLDPNSEPALGIGNHGGTFHHFPFHGSVDEWALYSRALSAGEIAAIFQAGGAGKCPPPMPPPAGDHDLSRDYSTSANPNGVWSYGWKSTLAGDFNRFDYHGSELDDGALIDYWLKNSGGPSSVYHNSGPVTLINNDGQGVYPPDTVWFGPGYEGNPDNFSVIRFTVPDGGGGLYRVQAMVRPALEGPISGDTDFHVVKNGEEMFGRNLPPNTGTSYSNLLALSSGDRIDFACGRGLDGHEYASALKIQATVTLVTNLPPPANCVSAPAGLVGWWRAEGNAGDAKANGDGSAIGGVSYEPGIVGQAFRIDGASGRISVPDADAFKLTEALSIEGWAKLINRDSGLSLFMRGDDRPGLDPYFLGVDQGRIVFGISDNVDADTVSAPFPMNQWKHVAATFEAGTGALKLYLDGLLVGQAHTTRRPARDLDPSLNPGLGIGNVSGSWINFPWDGWIDEISLYNRALSDAEVLAVFNAGQNGKCVTNQPPPPPTVYDASQDFSPSSNPTGAWSYGYSATLGGPFNLLMFMKNYPAENGVPISAWQVSDALSPSVNRVMGDGIAVSEGGAFTAPSGTVYVWPGNDGSPGAFGVIRFTVPAGGSGVYRIESAARSNFDGPVSGDSDFHVLKNGQELFGQFVAPNSATGYSNTLTLVAGETIDFAIGRGADGSPDHSSLKVHVTINGMAQALMSNDSVSFVAAGAFRVTGHGTHGTLCRVERSTDLLHWEPAGSAVEAANGVFEFIDSQPPAGPACFYRFLNFGP